VRRHDPSTRPAAWGVLRHYWRVARAHPGHLAEPIVIILLAGALEPASMSLLDGQMSFMYTGLPFLSSPIGSLVRSILTVPAIAYATTNRIADAERDQAEFEKVRATVPESSILFNNTSRDILGVAAAMVAGEIAYRKGEYDSAFAHLRTAVERDDALNYDEPWGWMQPARHALGALLLEQGRIAEAEQVYRNDLERHPKNVWALHGLAECLEKQGKSSDAQAIQAQFETASERCDVTVDRSCYCRLKGE